MKKVITLILMLFVVTCSVYAVPTVEDTIPIDIDDGFFGSPDGIRYDFPFEYIDYKEGENEISHIVFDENLKGVKANLIFKYSKEADYLCLNLGFSSTKNIKGVEEIDINIPSGYEITPGKHKVELWGKDTYKQLMYNPHYQAYNAGYILKHEDGWLPANGNFKAGDLSRENIRYTHNNRKVNVFKTPEEVDITPTTMFTGGGGILAPIAGKTFHKDEVLAFIVFGADTRGEQVGYMGKEELVIIKFVE